jgi:hypothetical protein
MSATVPDVPVRDRCPTCGCTLPDRSPNSPEVRYCSDHWWAEQLRRFDADEPINPDVAAWLTSEPSKDGSGAFKGVRHR